MQWKMQFSHFQKIGKPFVWCEIAWLVRTGPLKNESLSNPDLVELKDGVSDRQ